MTRLSDERIAEMDRAALFEALFTHLWQDRDRPDLLIREVLVGLIGALEIGGADFSKLKGHEDLAMWIAHSYAVGIDCWDAGQRAKIMAAFCATFPELGQSLGEGRPVPMETGTDLDTDLGGVRPTLEDVDGRD